jgi:adenosylcobinamide-GDP ribazoletransferase
LLAAVQFLTRLPVPSAGDALAPGLAWFPAVGVLLGAVLAAVDLGVRWLQVPSLLDSTLLVVLLLALSGGLHADGLLDTCDALLGHASPERRLEIMRDPRAGSFGVVGVVCVIALKIAALDSLPSTARPGLLLLAPALGRWAIVLVATVFPYGRPSGLGAPLKAAATPRTLLLASLVPAAASALLGALGVLIALLAGLVALALGRWMLRLLPGLTGDCYGAVCELVETAVWLGGALLGPRLV